MYSFTTTALPFHCIISAWYWFLSHFCVCVCGCLLTLLSWSSCLHFYTFAFCSVLWNFRRQRLRLPAAFSHIAGITHYIWFTVKVAAVQNTIGVHWSQAYRKKKKKEELIWCFSNRRGRGHGTPKALLYCFPAKEMRTDCLNLCGMSLYFFQWDLVAVHQPYIWRLIALARSSCKSFSVFQKYASPPLVGGENLGVILL